MWLKNLSLLNFKNYNDADLQFVEAVNIFTGDNGAGKTNLLDAIHYLCLCKSYFNPIDGQQIKNGADMFVVQGRFSRQQSEEQISCGVKRNKKKIFKRNKKEYERLADHIGLFPVVMISPYDTNLILDGSEERRRFLDMVLVQTAPSYLEDLIHYNKVLLNRNALLKRIAQTGKYDPQLLEIYNEKLVLYGHKIYDARKSFMDEFIPLFQEYYQFISEDKEQVLLNYQSPLNEAGLEQLLLQTVEKDRVLERTTMGIHKDELVFSIHEMSLKKFGSQGQQKSFLIALKLAQYAFLAKHKGFKPLLLLDDVFDKLDEKRIIKLMQMVSNQDFGQIFITDTDLQRVKQIFGDLGIGIHLFAVEKGEAHAI